MTEIKYRIVDEYHRWATDDSKHDITPSDVESLARAVTTLYARSDDQDAKFVPVKKVGDGDWLYFDAWNKSEKFEYLLVHARLLDEALQNERFIGLYSEKERQSWKDQLTNAGADVAALRSNSSAGPFSMPHNHAGKTIYYLNQTSESNELKSYGRSSDGRLYFGGQVVVAVLTANSFYKDSRYLVPSDPQERMPQKTNTGMITSLDEKKNHSRINVTASHDANSDTRSINPKVLILHDGSFVAVGPSGLSYSSKLIEALSVAQHATLDQSIGSPKTGNLSFAEVVATRNKHPSAGPFSCPFHQDGTKIYYLDPTKDELAKYIRTDFNRMNLGGDTIVGFVTRSGSYYTTKEEPQSFRAPPGKVLNTNMSTSYQGGPNSKDQVRFLVQGQGPNDLVPSTPPEILVLQEPGQTDFSLAVVGEKGLSRLPEFLAAQKKTLTPLAAPPGAEPKRAEQLARDKSSAFNP